MVSQRHGSSSPIIKAVDKMAHGGMHMGFGKGRIVRKRDGPGLFVELDLCLLWAYSTLLNGELILVVYRSFPPSINRAAYLFLQEIHNGPSFWSE